MLAGDETGSRGGAHGLEQALVTHAHRPDGLDEVFGTGGCGHVHHAHVQTASAAVPTRGALPSVMPSQPRQNPSRAEPRPRRNLSHAGTSVTPEPEPASDPQPASAKVTSAVPAVPARRPGALCHCQ
ncbi:hypothetical protein GCM10027612_73170 [Microbispora bryophytorum subsp. camponoti]